LCPSRIFLSVPTPEESEGKELFAGKVSTLNTPRYTPTRRQAQYQYSATTYVLFIEPIDKNTDK